MRDCQRESKAPKEITLTFKKAVASIDGRVIIPKGSAFRSTFTQKYHNGCFPDDYMMDKVFPHLTTKIEAFETMILIDFWHGECEVKIGSVIELADWDSSFISTKIHNTE